MNPTKRWESRQISRTLERMGADGLVVTTLVNIRYLTGFTGSNGLLLVRRDGGATLFTDGRYQDQAADEAPDVELSVVRDTLGAAAERMSGTWAVETHTLSVDAHASLSGGGARLVSAKRLVEKLREVKDAGEIASLERASTISVDALGDLIAGRFEGRTER